MASEELQKYVTEQRNAGVAEAALHEALLKSGWPAADIEEALKVESAVPVQKVTQHTLRPHRFLFFIVGIVVLMMIVGGVIAYFVVHNATGVGVGY